MQFLLDTHTFIWFIEGSSMLPQKVKTRIEDEKNDCFISIASLWEIAIKRGIGKITLASEFRYIADFIEDNNVEILPITFNNLQTLLTLEFHHRDPFDRIIIAQAISANLTILSVDQHFRSYPVKCIW